MDNIQLDSQGRLKHFLTIEGLPTSLLTTILDQAESFVEVSGRSIQKVPLLRGTTITNLFFEASTRTLSTFELAAKRLSADILNINIATSSTRKGETLSDMLKTLEAMQCNMFVIRHGSSGAAHFIACQASSKTHIINAGDGQHAHPTQAMLDMLTIRRMKGSIAGLKIAIIGDILHSRVARSEILALNKLGAKEIRLIGPNSLIPNEMNTLGATVYRDMEVGLAEVDVIIMLRLQQERMQGQFIPSKQEYFARYGLTQKRLQYADKKVIVMHPGPINRNVEISPEVADGSHSVINCQVNFGIATRMAIIALLMGRVPIKE